MDTENRTGLASIHVLCPQCYKSYSVEAADLNVERPKFQCVDCQCRFWIAASEALKSENGVIGFPVEWQRGETVQAQPTVTLHRCPKCNADYRSGQVECVRCGLIFSKYNGDLKPEAIEERKISASAPKEVQELWEVVIADYENIENHQNFISASWS